MKLHVSSSDDERHLYGDLAWTWPVISPPEDYIEEAEEFCRVIREHSAIDVRTLLDLGCGRHIMHYYTCEGLTIWGQIGA